MLDGNNQRDKAATVDGSNSAADQEKMDSYNSSLTPDYNQDPRNMSTRSLDYESVALNTIPGKKIFYYHLLV